MHNWIIIFLLLHVIPVSGQTMSDPGLKKYIGLWEREQTDSLKTLIAEMEKKFPKAPEAIFLKNTYETDGAAAYAVYLRFVRDYPKNIFAPEAYHRMIQYDAAAGRYALAQDNLIKLRTDYPGSSCIKSAETLFPAAKSDEATQAIMTAPSDTVRPTEINAGKKFRLQVGAFSDQKNAQELKQKLTAKGYTPIEFSEKTVNGKNLILVWVGAYATREDAKKAGDTIKSKEQLNYSIVEK
ncbi:SPOR domain-containing protein [bacterium]|nr:SPOR domain-containing protein [bacterium]NUN46963.1 SPOR domain-containing protein [bacterium]